VASGMGRGHPARLPADVYAASASGSASISVRLAPCR
jgi:hypothetical protein